MSLGVIHELTKTDPAMALSHAKPKKPMNLNRMRQNNEIQYAMHSSQPKLTMEIHGFLNIFLDFWGIFWIFC